MSHTSRKPFQPRKPAPAWPALKILANVREIPLGQLDPDPDQPRREFDADSIAELAGSLAALGQLQPIRVRPLAGQEHRYAIVVGERRYRAAQQAGLRSLACVVVVGHNDPGEVLAEQLAENTARADLAPMDRARALRRLQVANRATTVQIARELGLSQSAIVKSLALLDLPPSVQDMVEAGNLDPSSAYAISTLESPEQQIIIAADAVGQRLTRRTIEDLVRRLKGSGGVEQPPPRPGVSITDDGPATRAGSAAPGPPAGSRNDQADAPGTIPGESTAPRLDPTAAGLEGLCDKFEAEDAALRQRGVVVAYDDTSNFNGTTIILAGRDPDRHRVVKIAVTPALLPGQHEEWPSVIEALELALAEARRRWGPASWWPVGTRVRIERPGTPIHGQAGTITLHPAAGTGFEGSRHGTAWVRLDGAGVDLPIDEADVRRDHEEG